MYKISEWFVSIWTLIFPWIVPQFFKIILENITFYFFKYWSKVDGQYWHRITSRFFIVFHSLICMYFCQFSYLSIQLLYIMDTYIFYICIYKYSHFILINFKHYGCSKTYFSKLFCFSIMSCMYIWFNVCILATYDWTRGLFLTLCSGIISSRTQRTKCSAVDWRQVSTCKANNLIPVLISLPPKYENFRTSLSILQK